MKFLDNYVAAVFKSGAVLIAANSGKQILNIQDKELHEEVLADAMKGKIISYPMLYKTFFRVTEKAAHHIFKSEHYVNYHSPWGTGTWIMVKNPENEKELVIVSTNEYPREKEVPVEIDEKFDESGNIILSIPQQLINPPVLFSISSSTRDVTFLENI